MSQLFLASVGCPFVGDLDIEKDADTRKVICWLEDRTIREWEVSNRQHLSSPHDTSSDTWSLHFSSYLRELYCPFSWPEERLDCLEWLSSLAVSREYDDTSNNEMNDGLSINMFKLNALQERIRETAVGHHGLKNELCQLLRQRMSKESLLYITDYSTARLPTGGSVFDSSVCDQYRLETTCRDSQVSLVALVLKMLYLSEFRDLQSDVNTLIVLGQEFTANPKLNCPLGKVGR